MITSQYISFDHIAFEPESESPKREHMNQGRAILTNHRLVLLSAEFFQGIRTYILIQLFSPVCYPCFFNCCLFERKNGEKLNVSFPILL